MSNYVKFMIDKKVDKKQPFTHTRIGDKDLNIYGGKYFIPENELLTFYKLYHEHVFINKNPEYLTEKQLENSPILIDIDMRYHEEVTSKLHTKEHIIDMFMLYMNKILKICNINDGDEFPIYIMEKDNVNRIQDKFTKDGIHLIIGASCSFNVKQLIREAVMYELKELWNDLPLINTDEDLLDKGVCKGEVNWQMFGSCKPNNETYKLKYHYKLVWNQNNDDWDITEYDINKFILSVENLKLLSAQYTNYKTIQPKGEWIERANNLNKKKNNKTKTETKTETKTDVNILQYCELINNEYLSNREDWLKIVFAMKREKVNEEDALRISNKATDCVPLTDEAWSNVWDKEDDRENGCNIGTIKYYAKLSNEEEYNKLIIKENDEEIDIVTETSLARRFMKEKGKHIKYSKDIKLYYIYENNKWRTEDPKVDSYARQFISDSLKNYYEPLKQKIEKLFHLSTTEELYEINRKKIQKIGDLLVLIEKTTWKNNIWKEVQSLIAAEKNDVVFDVGQEQHYNIHFNNGVYDIKNKKFRSRTFEDYVTQILPYDYIPKEKVKQNAINETKELFEKIHSDEDQRKFQLSYLAYSITGNTGKQIMKLNIGYSASNGKSTELAIHQNTFPIYTCKLDKRTFNEGFEKRHKEFYQLIREPIRLAYIEELDRKKLDVDILKDFVDGKRLNVEILFGTKDEKSIQSKLITCSNKDFNMDVDEGVLRRCRIQLYKSRFVDKEDEPIDEKNHIYNKEEKIEDKYLDENYRNAYFHLLLEHIDNVYVPKIAKELFKETASEYDTFTNTLEEKYEITKNENDYVAKSDLVSHFELKHIKFEKVLNEIKRIGLIYDRQKRCKDSEGNSQKGVIYGLKEIA
jgi:phage/plasmid-associated DNA primase